MPVQEIDDTLPLADAAEAHRRVESGSRGRILPTPQRKATVEQMSDVERVDRAAKPIMFVRVPDELPAMQRAWAELEDLVGMRGRKFYGVFDEVAVEYRVCAEIRPDDPEDRFGLEVGELAGGAYLRMRLTGEPPAVYSRIGPGFKELHALAEADPGRHDVEFYRRRNEIELLMPVHHSTE